MSLAVFSVATALILGAIGLARAVAEIGTAGAMALAKLILGPAAQDALAPGRSTSSSSVRVRRVRVVTALALLLLSAAAGAAEKGWFGLALSVDADGMLTPTLRSVTIEKVFPSSPAARADLAAGDAILEIQGIVVAGTKADVLKTAMQKSVGETLRLKIRHGASEVREVSLVAVRKPSEQ